jgi:hypothetical protein
MNEVNKELSDLQVPNESIPGQGLKCHDGLSLEMNDVWMVMGVLIASTTLLLVLALTARITWEVQLAVNSTQKGLLDIERKD